jgi:hypothetical protein
LGNFQEDASTAWGELSGLSSAVLVMLAVSRFGLQRCFAGCTGTGATATATATAAALEDGVLKFEALRPLTQISSDSLFLCSQLLPSP